MTIGYLARIAMVTTPIPQGLEGSVEKMSAVLGRNAVYKKTSCVCRLPAYLTVQFVRFFVGKGPDSDKMVPKKILKVSLIHFTFSTVDIAYAHARTK